MINWLKKLIEIESISRNEKEITDFLESEMKKMSGELKRINNALFWQCPNFSADKKTIALVSHTDTVPFVENKWQITRPLSPLEKDGKIYGRGSSDMKGGLAVILDIISGKKFGDKFNVIAIFYDREELGFPNGITDLLEAKVLPQIDLAIVPEPTERQVVHGVFTTFRFRTVSHGKAVHSSKAYLGENAIYKLLPAIEAIKNISLEEVEGVKEAISVNLISGGTADNIVPDKAEISIDCRFDPKLSQQEVIARLPDFGDLEFLEDGFFPGFVTNPKTEILSDFITLVGSTKLEPYWTDIAQLGLRGIPAVNFGPGSADQAHTADEFVTVSDLKFVRDKLVEFLK
ncbi:M20/M25/M40 family metallo-hydrolase [Candidatus Gracilibacteria bacterium]|nr:M20/M25/M40 family metallo-hydrolase [Candidatus Gracilibacteria bacterium]